MRYFLDILLIILDLKKLNNNTQDLVANHRCQVHNCLENSLKAQTINKKDMRLDSIFNLIK